MINNNKAGNKDSKSQLELIVDNKILKEPQIIADYPKNVDFTSITDDNLKIQNNRYKIPKISIVNPVTCSKLEVLHHTTLLEVQNIVKSL